MLVLGGKAEDVARGARAARAGHRERAAARDGADDCGAGRRRRVVAEPVAPRDRAVIVDGARRRRRLRRRASTRSRSASPAWRWAPAARAPIRRSIPPSASSSTRSPATPCRSVRWSRVIFVRTRGAADHVMRSHRRRRSRTTTRAPPPQPLVIDRLSLVTPTRDARARISARSRLHLEREERRCTPASAARGSTAARPSRRGLRRSAARPARSDANREEQRSGRKEIQAQTAVGRDVVLAGRAEGDGDHRDREEERQGRRLATIAQARRPELETDEPEDDGNDERDERDGAALGRRRPVERVRQRVRSR